MYDKTRKLYVSQNPKHDQGITTAKLALIENALLIYVHRCEVDKLPQQAGQSNYKGTQIVHKILITYRKWPACLASALQDRGPNIILDKNQ